MSSSYTPSESDSHRVLWGEEGGGEEAAKSQRAGYVPSEASGRPNKSVALLCAQRGISLYAGTPIDADGILPQCYFCHLLHFCCCCCIPLLPTYTSLFILKLLPLPPTGIWIYTTLIYVCISYTDIIYTARYNTFSIVSPWCPSKKRERKGSVDGKSITATLYQSSGNKAKYILSNRRMRHEQTHRRRQPVRELMSKLSSRIRRRKKGLRTSGGKKYISIEKKIKNTKESTWSWRESARRLKVGTRKVKRWHERWNRPAGPFFFFWNAIKKKEKKKLLSQKSFSIGAAHSADLSTTTLSTPLLHPRNFK